MMFSYTLHQYGVKKLAYYCIKRSQQPFCIMAAEPENGNSAIIASNCRVNDISVSYSVEEILSKKLCQAAILASEQTVTK